MNRQHFLRLAAPSLAAALLPSCAAPAPAIPPKNWPPTPFATVRAVVYDCDADHSVSYFQKDGRPHRGTINGPGALLSPAQVRTLLPILSTPSPRPHRSACYLPHHAFLFCDPSGRVVAHSEICFNCSVQRSSPDGLPAHINFQALWNLLRELGVPCGDGSQFYRDLFQASAPQR